MSDIEFDGQGMPTLVDTFSDSAVTAIQSRMDLVSLAHIKSSRPRFESGPIALQGLKIDMVECRWDDSRLSMRAIVPDRDTGKPLSLDFDIAFDQRCVTEEELAECIVKAIANVIAHEVAENLFIRGHRFDPHGRPPFFTMKPFQRSFQKFEFGFHFGGEDVEVKAPTTQQLKDLEGGNDG